MYIFGQEGNSTTVTALVTAFIGAFTGLVGLMGWLIKHLFSTTLPQQAAVFQTTIDKVMSHCEEEAKLERDATERRHKEGMEAAGRLYTDLIQLIRSGDSEVLGAMRTLHQDQRDTVHAIRSLADSIQARTRLADAIQSMEVAAWTKTVGGVILSWNLAAESLLGWKQGEMVGQSVYDKLIPHDKKAEEERALSAIISGQSVEEFETIRLSRGGARVDVLIKISPIRDRTGQIIGASSVARKKNY